MEGLAFNLVDYKLCPFIELVESDDLWAESISAKEFERAKLLVVHTVSANK